MILAFLLISCSATVPDDEGTNSSNPNDSEPTKVCGLVSPAGINELSREVGIRHITLTICTGEGKELGFAVNTASTPVAKAIISTKYGYVERKFTKGVSRKVYLAVKTDASSNNTLEYPADALVANTGYYIHIYDGSSTSTKAFTTENYYTAADAEPGNVFALSPSEGTDIEFKFDEPLIMFFYSNFPALGAASTATLNGSAVTTCDGANNCWPIRVAASGWEFASYGEATSSTVLAHNMGVFVMYNIGTTASRFSSSEMPLKVYYSTGTIYVERNVNLKIVTE